MVFQVPQRILVLRCPGWERGSGPAGSATDVAGSVSADAARAFEAVVDAVEDFCPKVEVLRPGTCAIGVRGPARYFGGEQALAGKISAAVRELGFGCGVGIAEGLFAAGLAASLATGATSADPGRAAPASVGPGPSRVSSGPAGLGFASSGSLIIPPGETLAFLAGQPVSVLGSPELDYLLPRLGITTLGEFAALPAAEAASRFGAQGALAHRLASGLEPRPLVPRLPAADLSVQCEFDPAAEQSEPVVFAAKALAGELHARLAASGLACVRVRVLVRDEDGRESSRLWRHDGLLSDLAVAERVRWQLDGQHGADDGDDGVTAGGIALLRLIPDQLVPSTGRQLGLWGDAVVSDRVARAAIRVQAMLGHGAVTRPVLTGGRDPAEQVLLVPFGDVAEPERPADRPWPAALPPPAPATVYPEPLPAEVTDSSGADVTVTARARLSAPPATLSVAGQPAPGQSAPGQSASGQPASGQMERRERTWAITAWAGPWPVAERWWDPARARRQARFQLVTDDGAAWLAVLQDGRWLLLASYD
jgi:protein ImuB